MSTSIKMVYSRIAEFLSVAASRRAGSHSLTGPSGSSGLLPLGSSDHSFSLDSSAHKNNLRISSSLQDFSKYRRLEPEEGELSLQIGQHATPVKPPHPLQRESVGSSFSKERPSHGTSLIWKKRVRATLALLCMILFLFIIYLFRSYHRNYWSQETEKFYVVLDCGSTGTRVYVYQSSINHKKDNSLPFVLRSVPHDLQRRTKTQSGRAYQRMETEPGFDKLVHNVSGLRVAIKPLLRWAEEQIPTYAHKSTSLYLYATAGVRRLPSSDSEWLLNNAWTILQNSSFFCRRDWVRIITGMEEAYYGWIALNYHIGMLGSTAGKATYGALDLGGSSLQVTFETKELLHDETSLNLSIGTVNHHLSAYSLSGYGLNDAFDKSIAHLLKKQPGITNADIISGKTKLNHPCLQSGYKEQYICSRCASLDQDGGSPLITERNIVKGRKPGIAVELSGVPHFENCSALAKVVVNLSEWSDLNPGIDCEVKPCALGNSFPRPVGQFYAMSGFFVVFKFFNLTSEATLDDVLRKGQDFCEKTWQVAKSSVPPQPFIEQYCFRAPYIVSLLRNGLHISDKHVIIGSGSITWTLGVALLQAGETLTTAVRLPNQITLQLKINPIILFALVSISLVLLVCYLSYTGKWLPKFFRRPYLPLFRHNSATVTSVLSISSPFRFQRWSPINTGDGRVKMPLSPTIGGSREGPFSMNHGLGGGSIQLIESSMHPSIGRVSHSYSSGSLGQMQFENGGMGSTWTPHRGQILQSRRSQSREDLNSSLTEAHKVNV